MLIRIQNIKEEYPFQFWLLFLGMFISILGMSMIWPFLMIYVSEKLDLPMTQTASLITINASAALVLSFVAGPITDRIGRKWAMVFSLFANGLGFFLLDRATTLTAFAFIMGMRGAVNPLYQIGADAMVADLIPKNKRADAYALTRMSKNAGIALGPALGGFLAGISYSITFYFATFGLVFYALLIAFFAKETRPEVTLDPNVESRVFAGYSHIFQDRTFMSLVLGFTLTQTCATMVWVLLGVYTKENFGLPEQLYGFIPMTNALMVVFLQVQITNQTKQHHPLRVLALGTFFYAAAVSSISIGRGFWYFWISMVILTLGELMLVPTATSFAANLAPLDMRGRYMGVYSLSWSVAAGIGPVFGGFLNDQIGPRAIWLGGGLVGLVSTLNFLWLAWRKKHHQYPNRINPL
jgi:MFS family permease